MMRVRFWGVRGSIASAGPETAQVGGNTSCVEVRCGDGARRRGRDADHLRRRHRPARARRRRCAGAAGRRAPLPQPPALGPHPGLSLLRARLRAGQPHPALRARALRAGRRRARGARRADARAALPRRPRRHARRARASPRSPPARSSRSAPATVQAAAAKPSQRLPRLSRRRAAAAASSTPPTPSTTPAGASTAQLLELARGADVLIYDAQYTADGVRRPSAAGATRRPRRARAWPRRPASASWSCSTTIRRTTTGRSRASRRRRARRFPRDRRRARGAGADAGAAGAARRRLSARCAMADLLLPSSTDPERISEDRDGAEAERAAGGRSAAAARGRSRRAARPAGRPGSPRRCGADRGTLYLVDPEAGELFSKAAHLPELQADPAQDRAGHRRHRRRDGAGAQPAVGRRRSALLPRRSTGSTGYRTRSVLAAPLRDRDGHVIGVVQVLNARRGSFSAADEEDLKRLAAEAALAIENTSLYALVRPRRRDAAAPALPVRYRYNRIVGESAAMQRVYDADAQGGRHRRHGALARRERHRQGADRARHPLQQRAPRRPVREGRLHDHPADADGERAVRPRARRLHRRRGARRAASARRPTAARSSSTRSASCRCRSRPSSCASCRTASSSASAARARSPPTCASSRPPTATSRRWWGAASSARISTTASRWCSCALPPLRERGAEDMARLAEHFLDVYRTQARQAAAPFWRSGARAARGAPLAGQHPRAGALRRERGRPVRGRRDRRRRSWRCRRGRRARRRRRRRLSRAAAGRGRARAHPADAGGGRAATARAPRSCSASAATRCCASSRSTGKA